MAQKSIADYLKTYNSSYPDAVVHKSEFKKFQENLKTYFERISKASGNEEKLKDQIQKLLERAFGYHTEIAHKGAKAQGNSSIDLCTKLPDNKVGVIIETKASNKTAEMFSVGEAGLDINKKALHEVIYYYFIHIDDADQPYIKHLMLTDGSNFILIEPSFLGVKGNKFGKFCRDFQAGDLINDTTDFIYQQLKSTIETDKPDFNFCHFNLANYKGDNLSEARQKELLAIYKLLHPNFLHRQYNPRDLNKLNQSFYNELLFIFGLEQTKDKNGKLVIEPVQGEKGSVYNQIKAKQPKDKDEIIRLITIWLNRILFIKLFESQLISFNDKDKRSEYSFFSSQHIRSVGRLNSLFFNVLNTPLKSRLTSNSHPQIPYLNSSLFEKKELESDLLTIAELVSDDMNLYPHTVLRSQRGKQLPFIKYLLDFLDAYSFTEIDENEDLDNETKEIISSSVLGLVFEKINGYEDGAVFTPACVTEFMAKETVTRVVLDKFNELFQDKAPSDNIDELKNLILRDSHKPERKALYKKTLNSIRICDPSCGSGHFLVSVLNYLVYLRTKLGLMENISPDQIKVHNDSLLILDRSCMEQFTYKRNDAESAKVQKELFEVKSEIIRNCLFGSDINPTSTEICRLRLWIELLKNAYYKDGSNEMELLPNIDINIKEGDSLDSYVWAGTDPYNLFATPEDVKEYKEKLEKYKKGKYEHSKRADYENLLELKKNLKDWGNAGYVDWEIDFPEVIDDYGNFIGFDAVIGNPPYIQLQENNGRLRKKYEKFMYRTLVGTGDIYTLFYEQGWHLLKQGGYLCYITSNKWMRTKYGQATREFLSGNMVDAIGKAKMDVDPQILLDVTPKIFDNVTVDPNILLFKKAPNQNKTKCALISDSKDFDLDNHECLEIAFNSGKPWLFLSPIESAIKQKIEQVGKPIKDWDIKIYRGVLTGCNDAFVIDSAKRQEILNNCINDSERGKTKNLLQPLLKGQDIERYGYKWAGLWLINTHNGNKKKNIAPIDISDYPSVKKWLDKGGIAYNGKTYSGFKQIKSRGDKGNTPYNLRNCAFLEDFDKPKILWKRIGSILRFCFTTEAFIGLDSTCFATGTNIEFICCVLNSPMGHYLLKDAPKTGTGDLLISVQAVEPIMVPEITEEVNSKFAEAIRRLNNGELGIEKEINEKVFDLYNLSKEERTYITENYTKP